jgi:3-hydroxyacyl-CoA dehydrogenase
MKIRTVACIGAGLIGSSWATLFALKDMKVHLYDQSERSLRIALRAINSNLNDLVKYGCIEEKRIEKAKHNVIVTINLKDAVEEVDYVQESVFESYPSKKEIFKKLRN